MPAAGPRRRAARRLATGRGTAALLVAAVLLVAGCGGPPRVSLAELAREQERYDGTRVETSGIVRAFEDGRGGGLHHVIEDEANNRVAIPNEDAQAHVGEAVAVQGLFVFDQERGRRLEDIELLARSRDGDAPGDP